jgi:hypothetical protein
MSEPNHLHEPGLLPGEVFHVRSAQNILGTLDHRGTLDTLMPDCVREVSVLSKDLARESRLAVSTNVA